MNMKFNRGQVVWAVLAVVATLAVIALFAHPAAAMLIAPAAIITEEQFTEIAKKFTDAIGDVEKKTKDFDKASEEVRTLGKQLLNDAEQKKQTDAELKKQVDDALKLQGELKQQMLDLNQNVAKEIKKILGSMQEMGTKEHSIGFALEEAKDRMLDFGSKRVFGSGMNIPLSRKALMETGTTGTALLYPGQQVLPAPLQPLLRRLTIRDLLAPGRTSSLAIWYQRETGFTNNAAPVSEGSLKPKSDITFDQVNGNVKTIAHLMDISLQMLGDVPFIQSYVENRMRYGLKLVEENELLNGSGAGQHLNGIYTQATAYAQPAGSQVQAEQDLDKLRLAFLQVELAFADVTGIVLNPVSWANIELLKDSQNRYLIANPQQTTTGTIWARPVVSTQAMGVGNFLVGDFALYAQIFDREDANLAISFENKDNFERNMATLRLEERLALAVYRPEAFVKGKLESASH
jgi:HK97 family phage major capsid protein